MRRKCFSSKNSEKSASGTAQSVDLPNGKYKLQCWDATGWTEISHNGNGYDKITIL